MAALAGFAFHFDHGQPGTALEHDLVALERRRLDGTGHELSFLGGLVENRAQFVYAPALVLNLPVVGLLEILTLLLKHEQAGLDLFDLDLDFVQLLFVSLYVAGEVTKLNLRSIKLPCRGHRVLALLTIAQLGVEVFDFALEQGPPVHERASLCCHRTLALRAFGYRPATRRQGSFVAINLAALFGKTAVGLL